MFKICSKPIDTHLEKNKLNDPKTGSLVFFEGIVRDFNNNKKVTAITYEIYKELCQTEGTKIIKMAKKKFNLIHAICIHRQGYLKVGETSVFIAVSSSHRKESFLACQYIIDRLKIKLPIWKKEWENDNI